MGTPRQTFRVSELVWSQFQKKCAAKGYTASEVLRSFIMRVVKGEMSVEVVRPGKATRGETLVNNEMVIEWFKQNSHSFSNQNKDT